MGRILRLYVIREVALPSFLSLLTITFILLMGRVYDLIDLLMQPGVKLAQLGAVLLAFMPAMLIFAVPMAMLIGILVGVGRLTLDREILALRASGVNLFSVFFPAILLAGLISLSVMGLSSRAIPKMMLKGMTRFSELQVAFLNSLEPGSFHDDFLGKDNDLILYFRERDPKTMEMKGVTLKLEDQSSEDKDKDTGKGKAVNQPVADHRKTQLTMVFAESGRIEAQIQGEDPNRPQAEVVLNLKNGSIHQLNPDPSSKEYVTIRFKKFAKKLSVSTSMKKFYKTMSNDELRQAIASPDTEVVLRSKARPELIERHSISLASFIFALVGIPLAIWIRPSGKSWGILLAIGLMLVYYILMKMGLTMVEHEKPFGVLVSFLPNILFLALGAGLWWQSVRS